MSKRKRADRALADMREVARAIRPSEIVTEYESNNVYSLSQIGIVRQSMVFRKDQDGYSNGSGWNVKYVGMSTEEFKLRYSNLGFRVEEHESPVRINYDKPIQVGSVQKPATLDELELRMSVLELKLAGMTYQEIADKLDVERKRVVRIYRDAMR